MPLIHHPDLRVEREVSDRLAAIWTRQPRPGWSLGPLPDELRPTADPRLTPAEPRPKPAKKTARRTKTNPEEE